MQYRDSQKTEGEEYAFIDDEVFSFDVETGISLPIIIQEHHPMPIPSKADFKDVQRIDLCCRDLRRK